MWLCCTKSNEKLKTIKVHLLIDQEERVFTHCVTSKSERKTSKNKQTKKRHDFPPRGSTSKSTKTHQSAQLGQTRKTGNCFFEDRQLLSHMLWFLIETSKNKETADIWELPLSFRKVKFLPWLGSIKGPISWFDFPIFAFPLGLKWRSVVHLALCLQPLQLELWVLASC